MPSETMLEYLNLVGANVKSTKDKISEKDKELLLLHLRKIHGSDREKKIILTRNPGDGRRRTVQVEVRKKRTFVQKEAAPTATPQKPKDAKADDVTITGVAIENLGPDVGLTSGKRIRWSKLQSIEISNFKAVERLTVPLADVTILVGPNGSGKSSVLQAIHWAARAASYVAPRNQSESVSFERLDYSPSSEPLKTAHKKELSPERSSEPTAVVFNHVPTEDGSSSAATIKIWAARASAGISVSIEGGPAVTPFKQRTDLITAYIPGLAGLSEYETLLVQPLLRRQAAGGDAGGVLRNVLFNIGSRQLGETNDDAASLRVRQLNELVQIIHPGVSLEVTFNDREDIKIQATFDDSLLSGIKRPLETAATGVLQAIQIFAYLILFRPKLLLVDEPDAHLHPDKQERLIEALEHAAQKFDAQIILTTHSPHIVRAASPAINLLWVNQGKVYQQQDDNVRALLGWGGLDKKILFFVEDENDQAIRAILRQWPRLHRQLAICRCFGVDNLPGNSLLKGLLSADSFDVKVVIHRDRDFMTDKECRLWAQRYTEEDVAAWITTHSDAEAYFCEATYLSRLYNVSIDTSESWIRSATSKCTGARKVFFDKRKVFIRLLYENGGSPESEELWQQGLEQSPANVLGKTLHKALKVEVKASGYDDKLLDRFSVPEGYEVASDLRSILEGMLSDKS
ncbi:translation initiation factor IF-2 [Burkholderia aenigmatica]|uniref:Translation initiation factor IF-2 n=2 Tax=Burkholderiaceae TaxID=119060 RepID=A0A6P2QGA5_9BURK|nr:translation initiation factor IF-2 [Burkholderia aenigmatica]